MQNKGSAVKAEFFNVEINNTLSNTIDENINEERRAKIIKNLTV